MYIHIYMFIYIYIYIIYNIFKYVYIYIYTHNFTLGLRVPFRVASGSLVVFCSVLGCLYTVHLGWVGRGTFRSTYDNFKS